MKKTLSKKRAVILLSGGLDSTTTLCLTKSLGYKVHCLIFSYGQKHGKEVRKALCIARAARAKSVVIKIKLPWSGSSLLVKGKKIPAGKISRKKIPSTYVPGRNTIFISYALSFAEANKCSRIFIGANAVDYSGYPDCRPGYFREFNRLLAKSSLGAVKIETPLIRMSKKEIVLLAKKLKAPLHMTWSCYKGGKHPCGECDSCLLRAKGFREAGIDDPVV